MIQRRYPFQRNYVQGRLDLEVTVVVTTDAAEQVFRESQGPTRPLLLTVDSSAEM